MNDNENKQLNDWLEGKETEKPLSESEKTDWEMQSAMDALLRMQEGKLGLSKDFHDGLMSRVKGEKAPKPSRKPLNLKLFVAAAACLVMGIIVWLLQGPDPVAPPKPSIPAPLETVLLAPGWQGESRGAAYRIESSGRVRLERGELFVKSVPVRSGAIRGLLEIETDCGVARATGTEFYVGYHPEKGVGEMKSLKSKMRVLVLTGMVTLANGLGSVTGNANDLLAAGEKTSPVKETVTANTGFAVDLYKELAREQGDDNLFFSPYSISTVLAMALEGARGETAAEMGKVLHLPDAARRVGADAQLIPWRTSLIHCGFQEINEAMLTRAKEKDAVKLNNANALWADKTCPIELPFRETVEAYYKTGIIRQADFKGDYASEREKINAWISGQTKGRINALMPKGSLDNQTRMVLVNAICFKAKWSQPFNPNYTEPGTFTLADGSTVKTPMMEGDLSRARYGAVRGNGDFFPTPTKRQDDRSLHYPEKDGFTLLELPYKNGKRHGDFSMVFIVPRDPAGLGRIEKLLHPEKLAGWISRLRQRSTKARLPKFGIENGFDLGNGNGAGILERMGMKRAFHRSDANFTGIHKPKNAENDLFLSRVVHKAWLSVDEHGTEAAGATLARASRKEEEKFIPRFRADRPFLLMIRHVKTGTILFMGRMTDPTK